MNDNLGNRKYPRVTHEFPIMIDGRKGTTINIGIGGALVITDRDVPILEEVAIHIVLSECIIRISGTCLRSEKYEHNYHLAIMFDESSFSRDDIECLRKHIEQYIHNDPRPPKSYGPQRIP